MEIAQLRAQQEALVKQMAEAKEREERHVLRGIVKKMREYEILLNELMGGKPRQQKPAPAEEYRDGPAVRHGAAVGGHLDELPEGIEINFLRTAQRWSSHGTSGAFPKTAAKRQFSEAKRWTAKLDQRMAAAHECFPFEWPQAWLFGCGTHAVQ